MSFDPFLWTPEHRQMQALLPAYAHAVVLGQADDHSFQKVVTHLEHCPLCRAELFDLVDASYTLYLDTLPQTVAPKPDLAFLSQDQPMQSISNSSFVIQFSEALLESIRDHSSALGQLRSQNRRLIGTYRQSAINIPDVKIELYEGEAHCALLHCYIQASQKDVFDQSGTDVIVYADGQRWTAVTDADGFVELEGIPIRSIAQMRIEIVTA